MYTNHFCGRYFQYGGVFFMKISSFKADQLLKDILKSSQENGLKIRKKPKR